MQNDLESLKVDKEALRDSITNYENLLNDLDAEKVKV